MVLTLTMVTLAIAPAMAWKWEAHRGVTEAVAGDRCGAPNDVVDEVRKESVWPDKPAAEDGEGTWGYDEEKNPWYDPSQLWYTSAGANVDQWLDVYNYNNGLWPVGEAHVNAAEFIQNGKDYVGSGYVNFGMDKIGKGSHYMQDMGVAYHTVLWENIKVNDHLDYETWGDDTFEQNGLGDWASYGAYYSDGVTVNSKSDIKDTTAELAKDANGRKSHIFGRTWDDNVWASQYNMWDVGQHTAAVYEYAAPGYFDC